MISERGVWTGLLVVVLAAVIGSTIAAPARAQEMEDAAAEGADAPPPRYQEAVDQALAESSAGRWAEARALFREAHEVFPNARTLRGIGMVSFELRDYVDALRHLRLALTDDRRPLTERQRLEVQALITRCLELVATYTLEDVPEGATITVDGRPIEPEPDGTLLLSVGEHEVQVHADRRWQSRIPVRGGENEPLPIVFSVPDEVPAPTTGPTVVIQPRPAPGPSVGGIVLTIASGVALIAGVAMAIGGLVDSSTVQNASRGTEWADLEAAYGRAPILLGVGFPLAVLGLAGTIGGAAWIAAGDGTSPEQAGLRFSAGGSF